MNRTATSVVPPADDGEGMLRALRYLEKLSTIIRFPGEKHDLSRSGKARTSGRASPKAGPRNAARFDSDSVSLDIRLAPANEPLASGRESHFPLGRDHCEGDLGAAPLSSEIGAASHRSSSDAPIRSNLGSSRRNCAQLRGVAARQIR